MEKDKLHFARFDESQKRENRLYDDSLQYLLVMEEQILQAITARAPLPGILNAICCALDCQIGNMVSLISLPSGAQISVAQVASTNAALFGLHIFHSTGILTENGQTLGLLEMFCCVRRTPSSDERQLIERAVCLAGIAIKHYNETGKLNHHAGRSDWSAEDFAPPWPVSVN